MFQNVSALCEKSSITLLIGRSEKQVSRCAYDIRVRSGLLCYCVVQWHDEPGAIHVFEPETHSFSQFQIPQGFSELLFGVIIAKSIHQVTAPISDIQRNLGLADLAVIVGAEGAGSEFYPGTFVSWESCWYMRKQSLDVHSFKWGIPTCHIVKHRLIFAPAQSMRVDLHSN